MKKSILIFLTLISFIGVTVFTSPASATKAPDCGKYTQGSNKGKDIPYCCGKDSNGNPIQTSVNFGDKCANNSNTITALLLYIIDFLAIGVGIAVVGGIAWGGFVYAQAGGDSSKTKQAVSTITNAVIGLVLFLLMYGLANFFVPGGIFN